MIPSYTLRYREENTKLNRHILNMHISSRKNNQRNIKAKNMGKQSKKTSKERLFFILGGASEWLRFIEAQRNLDKYYNKLKTSLTN